MHVNPDSSLCNDGNENVHGRHTVALEDELANASCTALFQPVRTVLRGSPGLS